MGCTQGRATSPSRALRSAARDAAAHEPARRLRLPGLRVAGSQTHLIVRVLRERRQGSRLGSDRQALHAGILRRPHASPNSTTGTTTIWRCRGRSPTRWSMTPPSDTMFRSSWDRGFALDRPRICARCRSRTRPTSIPPVAPPTRPRSSISSSRANTAPTIFPTAPTCATRRRASACPQSHRRRQRHSPAGGFRPRRRDLHLRPEPGHQQPAHDDEPAQRLAPRRAHHLASIRSASARWSGSRRRRAPIEMATLTLDADQHRDLPGARRRRLARPQGHHEGDRRSRG